MSQHTHTQSYVVSHKGRPKTVTRVPIMEHRTRVPKRLKSLWGSLAATAQETKVDGVAVLSKVATELFESLQTPVSLSCEILLRYGEIAQLARKTVDPKDYNDQAKFADDYQAISFLRKVPFQNVEGLSPEAEAKKKFFEAEAQCKETNHRIRTFLAKPERASAVARQAFCLAVSAIREVLGDVVSSAEWLSGCRFGPGAFNHPSVSGLTSIYDKLQVCPSVTRDFREAGAVLVMSSPSWARSVTDTEVEGFWPFVSPDLLHETPGNRVTFVPKTATTERAIAIEPLVNIYAQLGLGRMIRRRLDAVAHIDLNDQSLNQQLAREGSIRGFLATIDLSSASDTVARELVRALLPEAWYKVLDITRSKVGVLDGTPFVYEKFSSMGNGFTFELESLIFWALSRSACVIAGTPEMVSVYGDDIVVPVDAYDTLEEILTFFGFTFNKAKSFKSGPFRESCGKDYYNGCDVRPFLQTEVPEEVQDLFTLANGLRRLASRRLHPYMGCDVRFRRAWKSVVSALPRCIASHVRVPAHAGDSDGLVCNWDEAQISSFVLRDSGGMEGWFAPRMNPTPIGARKVSNFEGAVASLLYRAKDGFGSDYASADPRQGRDVTFELRNGAYYGPWTDLGPWMQIL